MKEFNQLVSINHQGLVIVFARPNDGDTKKIFFNVLGLDVDTNDDAMDWSGFKELEFTRQVRQVGMSIVTVDQDETTMETTAHPFKAITDQKYISIIQQSAKGTLYINRFRLVTKRTGSKQKNLEFDLSPAWEVRFSRSHKEDVPADTADTQEYLDPNGQPFLEPSFELSMIDSVSEGAFDVLLLPVSASNTFSWQFFSLDKSENSIHLYNFSADDKGLFTLSGKAINDRYQIVPDSSFSIINAASKTLDITQAPRVATYVKHEKIVQPDGSSIGVKRAARVMVSLAGMLDNTLVTATVDSAVGAQGVMAELSGAVEASAIVPAEFDLLFDGIGSLVLKPPSQGENVLAISGPYSFEFMLMPKALGNNINIIGGSTKDVNKLAPYAKISEGDKLSIGFGNGTELISCTTKNQVFSSDNWASVKVDYKGAGDNPFTVFINGSKVALTDCATSSEPVGTVVDLIGDDSDGFVGALNAIKVYVGGRVAVDLPCNEVDYSALPATTPNLAASGIGVDVFGAKLEASSAPVLANTNGRFYIDAKGLTYYVGTADFIQPESASCLIDGSDGMLHLYYKGENEDLSVAQFSTLSARASFYSEWLTRPDGEDEAQSGFINFISHRVGSYMNDAQIEVTASATSNELCDISADGGPGIGKETWTGLPRDIDLLTQVWNGGAAINPDDQDVLNGSRAYFDYSGTTPAVIAPSTDSEGGGYFLFTSVPTLALDLSSVEVLAGQTEEFVNLSIETTSPDKWAGKKIQQSWPNVPASPRGVSQTMSGTSTNYDYSLVVTTGTRAYGVRADTARSDDQASVVSIFVQDSLSDFSLRIENAANNDHCKLVISGITLNDVPRDQIKFTRVVNGEDADFNYPNGYEANIASKIYALSDGLTANVLNGNISNNQTVSALAYASLIRLLYTGQEYDSGNMSLIAKTDAEAFQSAKLEFKQNSDVIKQSLLFGALALTRPTSGATGKLQDTAEFTAGKAPQLQLGINGGWTRLAPEFSLGFNGTNSKNYAQFNIDKSFSPADKLAIDSDMTLEAWLNQDFSKTNLLSRALTYNVEGNIENPDLPIQYMVGTKLGPGLIIDKTTFVNSSYNFDPPDLSVQIYVKPQATNRAGSIFSINEIRGSAEFIHLSMDSFGKANVSFLGRGDTLIANKPLKKDEWTCLSVTVSDAGNGKVSLALYLDDEEPQTTTVDNDFSGKLGSLTVGHRTSQDLIMTVNGAAFWQRALTKTEVQNSVEYGFADNDESLGIRWNFAEGHGTRVANSAATGSEFDTNVVNPGSQAWDTSGAFYVPYLGRNNYVLASNRIIKGWTHVAMASSQGYGLRLLDNNYGKIEDGSAFNPGDSLALEAWINPDQLSQRQVLMEKPGSYVLYTNTIGEICLDLSIRQDNGIYQPPTTFTHNIRYPIPPGKTSYVAVNFTCGTVEQDSGSEGYLPQKYFIKALLYINGIKVAENNKEDFEKPLSVDNESSSFYVGVGKDKTFFYSGLLSNLRVWSKNLKDQFIKNTYELRLPPVDKDGLIGGWNFDEQNGTIAKGLSDNSDLQLSSNQLWTIWQDVSYSDIYVNGRASLPLRMQAEDLGGYGDKQFVFGGKLKDDSLNQYFAGEMDDVRLHNTLLTAQQIREGMNSPLNGLEDNLAGYWKIDAGSGATIFDMTGRGNKGLLLPAADLPLWEASSAPISNEGKSVKNVLGGKTTINTLQIASAPSVIEYSALEKDAYGKLFGVMKRAYFLENTDKRTVLETGYKVGSLDTIYVGQIQSQPSVVGFIEGGPPLPSENQTFAYWHWAKVSGASNPYYGASSVEYRESESKTWSFSGSQSSTFEGSFNIKGGFYLKSKTDISAGLGLEAGTEVLETKLKFGLKSKLSGNIGGSDGVNQSHSNTSNISNSLSPSGTWEPADNILNPEVGRRYMQNNTGIAVVKSATADLFMLALKGTKTPVSYSVVPNVNIPIDTNIIDFPINPKYIKNGTLDGKVGLENDPDYPNANIERGSYFKPVEAYAIKQKIEKEEQQIKAYYDQFDADKYRTINSLDNIKNKLAENGAYDFSKKLNQRSIFNNYVWSAGGGLHKEEHSVANSYSENYTGASSLTFAAGLETVIDVGTPFGGFYLEADFLLGNTWQMTATKNEATANAFSLSCNVSPSGSLVAPIISYDENNNIQFDGYTNTPAPGKVDGYRYMSFFLAPSDENFTTLTTKVIDPNWFANSSSAAANAMRQAVAAENGAWRVLYRTTYVSRIPPPFQPVKDDTAAPNVTPPANLASNYWLTGIVAKLINSESPTPLIIGAAIDSVLGAGGISNGILNKLIPWWSRFYAASLVYGSDEFKEMAELREDLLQYMIDKYESEKHLNQ